MLRNARFAMHLDMPKAWTTDPRNRQGYPPMPQDRDMDARPYSPDEARVAAFFVEAGLGGGIDPIGSLIAAHRHAMAENGRQRWLLKAAGISSDGPAELEAAPAEAAWRAMIEAARGWASRHMDQWEQVKFQTEFGTVYLTLSRESEYPDAFDEVDEHGRPVGKWGG